MTNSELSDSFVGIEKFLSTEFVEHLQQSIGLSLQVPASPEDEQWRYDVKRARMRQLKAKLHADLLAREDPDDIRPLMTASAWLTEQLSKTPTLF